MEFDEIFETEHNKMTALSICRAADMDVLESVIRLFKETSATFHLVDDKAKLTDMLRTFGEEFADHDRMTLHHADNDKEAASAAVGLVAEGKADILMKGLISTSVILKEVLNKRHGLVESTLLSHVALFDLPHYHKAVLLSDAAMNIAPDAAQKLSIIQNAIACSHQLGISNPKVAMLSAVEKVNDKIQSTVDAAEIIKMKNISDQKYTIDGPLQYDLAISKKAAEHKGLKSDVAGNSDILIVPGIETGNVLYKSLVYSAGARVASVITGARAPIVLTSRADSAEDKYNSIRFAMRLRAE